MSATTNRISAAFFDVDGTVTTRTTIFGFLAYYLSHRGDGPEAARAVVDQLHWLRAQGHSRESVNRAYYRTYAGERRDRLESLGRQWFAYESGSGDFFVPEVRSEIDGYRRVGIPIVLVSGSFFACLDPLAEHLGADEVHGSPLVIEDGVLTGELETPLIGESKVRVLAKVTAAHG